MRNTLALFALLFGGCFSGGATNHCLDGTKNLDETGVDCGGASCPRCGPGQGCLAGTDCQGGTCTNNICGGMAQGGCSDGIKNGTETDVDCGGTCAACGDGKSCLHASDCSSGSCNNNLCQAAAPGCSDGMLDGDETDVDCGGSCAPCADGKMCLHATDCQSASCNNNVCGASANCNDSKLDGNETDVDCGGGCPPCAPGKNCKIDGDCASGGCGGGKCCAQGTGNCDGNGANGCETQLGGDPNNCGKCGHVCANNTICSNGACVAGGMPVTYSVSLTEGVTPSQQQCDNWDNFRAQLTGNYTSITIKGSNDNVGVNCQGQTANTICQGIASGANMVVFCNNRGWAVDSCNGGIEVSASTGNCQCDNAAGYTIRPCVGTPDWGGVNTATCNPPSQNMQIICQ